MRNAVRILKTTGIPARLRRGREVAGRQPASPGPAQHCQPAILLLLLASLYWAAPLPGWLLAGWQGRTASNKAVNEKARSWW